jgi:protein-S-isoprenylcysteine O-methyltransferase Ste14
MKHPKIVLFLFALAMCGAAMIPAVALNLLPSFFIALGFLLVMIAIVILYFLPLLEPIPYFARFEVVMPIGDS